MSKFFYIFLLNLLVFSEGHSFDARLSDYTPLGNYNFEIDNSELNGIENLNIRKEPRDKRETEPTEEEFEEEELRTRRFGLFDGLKKPFVSFSANNFQKFPLPANNIGIVETSFDQDPSSNLEECREKIFPKTVTKWKDDIDPDDCRNSPRKWRKGLRKRREQAEEQVPHESRSSSKVKTYLDYTNSQMPFNEGRVRHTTDQDKKPEAGGGTTVQGEKASVYGDGFRFRSLRKRMIGRPNEYYKIPGDDPTLKYSRVRRFLDGRSKKRIRTTTTTLEAKEAAMSRILDPNLNSDGILEPHVRKRRKRFIKKCGSSLKRKRNQRREPYLRRPIISLNI